MKKSDSVIDLTTKEPLIERQRKIWAISDAIDLANYKKEPLREDVARFLFEAMRHIAFGEDANAVFDVIPEKRGAKKNGFKLEFEKKFAITNVAASTSSAKKKTKEALAEVGKGLPDLKASTVKKHWNSSSAERKSGFTPAKK